MAAPQFDTTFHISDLLVVGGGCCTAIVFIGRAIVKAVRQKVQTIDATLTKHGHQISKLEVAKAEHEAMLKTLGFKPGTHNIIVRRDPESIA